MLLQSSLNVIGNRAFFSWDIDLVGKNIDIENGLSFM